MERPLPQPLPAPERRAAFRHGRVRIRHPQRRGLRAPPVGPPGTGGALRLEGDGKNRQCAPARLPSRGSFMATISKPPQSQSKERLVVYQHSDLLYWWVVWAYGLVCAALTYIQGVP